MEKYPLIGKGLAIGIILLFIGVAFASSINYNVVKASNDNDLVEVTSEACGIKGFGNSTVKLTKQQYQNLEQYLVNFRARLNQTTTREEAVPLFKEAVVELNKYGLLPRGMSVAKINTVISDKNSIRSQIISSLVCGRCSNSYMYGIPLFIFSKYFWLLFALFVPSILFFNIYVTLKMFNILGVITVGSFSYFNGLAPSNGWIFSSIFRYWQGSLFGGQSGIFLFAGELAFPGIIGFSGIRVSFKDGTPFFIGSALMVKIGSEPPPIWNENV